MNKQSFDIRTEKEKLYFDQFLNTLLDYNKDLKNDNYHEIHIYPSESLMIIEWDTVPRDHSWGGTFEYVEANQAVLEETHFPDGHCEYLFPDSVNNTLKEWKEQHPEWVMTSWGTWTNVERNREAQIELRSSEWEAKIVDKEQDPLFSESIYELNPDEETQLDVVICSVDDKILSQTQFVVVGRSLAYKFDENALCQITSKILKLDDIYVFDPETPKHYKFPVYLTDFLHHDVIYYLSNDYKLLHRLIVEEK